MSTQINKTTFKTNKSKASHQEVNQAIFDACVFVTNGVSVMINNMAFNHYNKVLRKTSNFGQELHFNVFDVKKKYMETIGLIKNVNGKRVYDPSILPFTTPRGSGKVGFSFDTIWNRCFKSKKTVTDIAGNEVEVPFMNTKPFERAGIKNALVVDVKRTLNPFGIKVWDVSDTSKSKMMVWKVTIFPNEDNWKISHGLMPAIGETVQTPDTTTLPTPPPVTKTAPKAPVKKGKWLMAAMGENVDGDKVKKDLTQDMEAAVDGEKGDDEKTVVSSDSDDDKKEE